MYLVEVTEFYFDDSEKETRFLYASTDKDALEKYFDKLKSYENRCNNFDYDNESYEDFKNELFILDPLLKKHWRDLSSFEYGFFEVEDFPTNQSHFSEENPETD